MTFISNNSSLSSGQDNSQFLVYTKIEFSHLYLINLSDSHLNSEN